VERARLDNGCAGLSSSACQGSENPKIMHKFF